MLWDIRQPRSPVLKIETIPGIKDLFQIHEQAPVMACGTSQDISIMDLKGRLLGSLRNDPVSSGFLGRVTLQSSLPSASLGFRFHPKKLLLASCNTAAPATLSLFLKH